MRIGVLSDPNNFHTQKWAQALQAAGASVTVFSLLEGVIPGVPCVYIPPNASVNGKLTYGSYLYSGQKLREALEAHKIDLINPINITPFGVWGMKSGFRPMVSIAMGADILEYPPHFDHAEVDHSRAWNSRQFHRGIVSRVQYRIKWQMFRRYIQQTLEASDLITGDNLELVKAVREWFGIPKHKVKLNRWGIEPYLFETTEEIRQGLRQKYQIRDWQKVVLSPRGMKPVYQADHILESFALLLRRGVRDIKFIMLSAGYEVAPEIEQKARQLADQFGNFYYERNVLPREELLQLWSIVDAFVSAPVYDGYSNALAEGRYASAVPIVNAIPAHKELIRHQYNGWVIDPFSPEHLADGILKLMEEYDFWKAHFAPVNRTWILRHSTLQTNVAAFLEDCEKVLIRSFSKA